MNKRICIGMLAPLLAAAGCQTPPAYWQAMERLDMELQGVATDLQQFGGKAVAFREATVKGQIAAATTAELTAAQKAKALTVENAWKIIALRDQKLAEINANLARDRAEIMKSTGKVAAARRVLTAMGQYNQARDELMSSTSKSIADIVQSKGLLSSDASAQLLQLLAQINGTGPATPAPSTTQPTQ